MTGKLYGEIPENEPVRMPPPRKRWKTLRHHFCDGIEAAVKAEPQAFQATKPRTMLGLMVHSVVGGAATGRCDQIKLVVFFLDEAERRRVAAEQSAALDDNSEGNSEAPPEPKWDWTADGVWGFLQARGRRGAAGRMGTQRGRGRRGAQRTARALPSRTGSRTAERGTPRPARAGTGGHARRAGHAGRPMLRK